LFLFAIASLIFASACASPQRNADDLYTLSGSTRFNGVPLATGEITALTARPEGRAYHATVNPDGSFQFKLPGGPYFLMGKSQDPASSNSLFSFWTNNPVHLYGDIPVPVILPFVTTTANPQIINGQGIRGKVLLEGEPVAGAVVAIFLDASGDFHGLPYQESALTGSEGEFYIDAQPGKYFVLARYREGGGTYQGPLLKGDHSGFYPHNPVMLRSGEGLILDVPMVQVNRPRGTGTLVPGEAIIVQGKVRTVTGGSAAGVRVVLYSIPEMLGRPAYISSPAEDDGTYRLEVSRSGKFYVAARSVIGRPPETGELMGYYDGTGDHALILKWGDRLEGVDIVVKEVW